MKVSNVDTKCFLAIDCNNTTRPIFKSSKTELLVSEDVKKYKKALAYVDSKTKNGKELDLDSCNLKKLEGIQYGIKILEGLDIKQIYALYKHLRFITVYRGCSNLCSHCFAEAVPPAQHKKNNLLYAMSWEDFQETTQGLGELSRRFKEDRESFKYPILPFLDAEPMEISLKDKNGKLYDYIDIVEKIKSDFGRKLVFDTSGWNPKSSRMQQRAEKYVQHIVEGFQKGNNGFNEYYQTINISLNPFHKLHEKYIELIDSNPEKAEFSGISM